MFADLKKNIKVSKEKIPAVTQLFTPDWIVRYMVENSLGRLWLEGHPNDTLKANWKYYLDEAEQEPEVQVKLEEMRKERASLNPEDIRCIDKRIAYLIQANGNENSPKALDIRDFGEFLILDAYPLKGRFRGNRPKFAYEVFPTGANKKAIV